MSGPAPDADLFARIATAIRAAGPMTLADYMAAALYDPRGGYYTTREPFGVAGDFTTAPEISQIFGEMIGLWLVRAWLDQGAPAPFILAEIGPGRGTLMRDVLRAARVRPGFAAAATTVLIETSPRLRDVQRATLAGHDVIWADSLAAVPGDGPLFLVANELFDAMPIRQFSRGDDGWREHRVGLDRDRLVLGRDGMASPAPPAPRLAGAPSGFVAEISPAREALMAGIAARIAAAGGATLAVDYGYAEAPGQSTFQALSRHRPVDPFAAPGAADLTAHVDFAALALAAAAEGAAVHGPVPQGLFLERLGGAERARGLARANPAQAATIAAAWYRLAHPGAMGTLFKVLAVMPPRAAPPPGFA